LSWDGFLKTIINEKGAIYANREERKITKDKEEEDG
jgi:hypothetical protein